MIDLREYTRPVLSTTQRYEQISLKFLPLIGKTIIVFVDGGGMSGGGFTGILIEVLSDSIKLITKLPTAPNMRCHRGTGFRSRNRKQSGLGTYTEILLNHVTAFTYFYE